MPLDACGPEKNSLMHQKHQNKLLHTCLGPWQHVEANWSIRRCWQILRSRCSPPHHRDDVHGHPQHRRLCPLAHHQEAVGDLS